VNFVRGIFAAPNIFAEARGKLNLAIQEYTAAITTLGVEVGLQLFTLSKKMDGKIDNLSAKFGAFSISLETKLSGGQS